MFDISLWAVLLAAVLSFAFGALWYSPVLFLKEWGHESGLDADKIAGNPVKVFGLSFGFTLVSAFVFSLWLGPDPGFLEGLFKGFYIGAFFVAASMGINYQFENNSIKLWLIDGGYHVVRFAIMGIALGLWPY